MKYISLNHNSQSVNFKTAVINGLAPDRGLYFPEKIINLSKKIIDNIKRIDDYELCYEVIKEYVGNDFLKDELVERPLQDIKKGLSNLFDLSVLFKVNTEDSPEEQAKKKSLHQRFQKLTEEQQQVAQKQYQEEMQQKKLELTIRQQKK